MQRPHQRLESGSKDCRFANCRDAKVCVLDWDAETQTIATTSLHSFEGEKAVLGGDTVFLHAPKLVTDPQVGYFLKFEGLYCAVK